MAIKASLEACSQESCHFSDARFKDITDKELVEALPNQIVSMHGSIDGIINDAGIIQPFEGSKDIGLDTLRRVMDVNFYGTLYMTRTFLPYLMTRPEAHITGGY